jgi:hypothetical protein
VRLGQRPKSRVEKLPEKLLWEKSRYRREAGESLTKQVGISPNEIVGEVKNREIFARQESMRAKCSSELVVGEQEMARHEHRSPSCLQSAKKPLGSN